MEKPILKNELNAKINGVSTIENNIGEAKEYALQLKEYYSSLVFTDEQLDEAKNERASINKITKKIADYRKSIIAEFKKPIDLFETTAKETEKILKETSEFVDLQVKNFENKEKQEKNEECKKIYNEKIGDMINYLSYEKLFNEKWLNKTFSLKSVSDEIEIKKMEVSKGIETIQSLNSKYQVELINEYLKSFDLNKAILLNNELLQNEAKYSTTAKEEPGVVAQQYTEEECTEKFAKPIEKKTYTLKLTGTIEQLVELRKYLEKNNIKFEKVGD